MGFKGSYELWMYENFQVEKGSTANLLFIFWVFSSVIFYRVQKLKKQASN